jgi:hypothetical protein
MMGKESLRPWDEGEVEMVLSRYAEEDNKLNCPASKVFVDRLMFVCGLERDNKHALCLLLALYSLSIWSKNNRIVPTRQRTCRSINKEAVETQLTMPCSREFLLICPFLPRENTIISSASSTFALYHTLTSRPTLTRQPTSFSTEIR